MKTKDFYYDLPPELIAQTPLAQRDASRMLYLDRRTGALQHRHFTDLCDYLAPGDCLVINNSRVLPARLLGHREPSGGAVEVLLLQDKGDGLWECLTKPGRKTKEGTALSFGDGALAATVEQVLEGGNRLVRFHYTGIFLEILERLGKMPLPPYIREELEDGERYQTVYSKINGSAAAPTAGLHFTETLLEKNRGAGRPGRPGDTACRPGDVPPRQGGGDHGAPDARGVLYALGRVGGDFEPDAPVRRPDHLRRDDILPDAGILGRAGWLLPGKIRLDGYFHLPRLPV